MEWANGYSSGYNYVMLQNCVLLWNLGYYMYRNEWCKKEQAKAHEDLKRSFPALKQYHVYN